MIYLNEVKDYRYDMILSSIEEWDNLAYLYNIPNRGYCLCKVPYLNHVLYSN